MRVLKQLISDYLKYMKKIHEVHNKGFKKQEVELQPMDIPKLTLIDGGLSDDDKGSKYVERRLSELGKKTMMEKHGVAKDENKTKTASTLTGSCPMCGGDLTKEGDNFIEHCPKCGTEPFEQSLKEID